MNYVALNRRRFIGAMAAGSAMLGVGRAAYADELPKTMRFVVSYTPGGASDSLARALATGLANRTQNVVITENKPGAGGLVAMQATKTAPPDGSVLFTSSAASIIQSLDPENGVHLERDFEPVMITHRGHFTLFVNADLPVTSLAELIAYDKANPGKLSYASFGMGGQSHLAMELLKQKTGMTLTHVPYKSNAETVASVLKGETQVSLNPYTGLKQHIDAGKLRALAVTSQEPSDFAPGVPSMKEAGVDDYEVTFWFGVNAPAGTPRQTLDRLNRELNVVLLEPTAQSVIRNQFGAATLGGTREDFARIIDSELKMYGDLIRSANLDLKG
ncbi:MAG: Bug family tripartite tricarboxylate transporter substrate binding protein [Pigmentiphaga sp.]